MPSNLVRTERRGVQTNGTSFYVNARTPLGTYRWRRFETYDEAVAFQDERVPLRAKPTWRPAAPAAERPGWVYFVASVGGGLVKIGYSVNDPRGRLVGLQCGSPVKLEILGKRRGFREDEERLHERFAHLRQHGEWFLPEPELLQELALTDAEVGDAERQRWAAVAARLRAMRSSIP